MERFARPVRQSPYAVSGLAQIAQQLLHAGDHAGERIIVARDVIGEDIGDFLALLPPHIGQHLLQQLAVIHTILIVEETARVVIRADPVDQFGRVSPLQGRAALPVQHDAAEIEDHIGNGTGSGSHANTLLNNGTSAPPVYRTRARRERFRPTCGRFTPARITIPLS